MTRKKSVKEKKIEASLGIDSKDDPEDFDMSDEVEKDEDDEAAAQVEKRREIVSNTKNALAVYKDEDKDKGYDGDEEFTRDMLRDLAVTGMTILKLQEEEMQIDPSARSVETAATLITSVTNAVDKLNHVGLNKKKLELDEKKVEARTAGGLNVTNNFIGASSFSDLVKGLKEADSDIGKISSPDPIEVEAEVEAEVVDDKSEDEGDDSED